MVIKRQEGKLLERKWRECWEIVKIKELQTSTNLKEEKFQQNLLERMERQENLFQESMQSLQENLRTLM